MYGWPWNKNEFQSQPNATGPTPASQLDPNRPRIRDWRVGYPFYRGLNWSDYLSQGALVQSKNLKIRNILFGENPTGTLAVSERIGKEMYIPYFSGTIVSNTKIPNGYYKSGSTIKVVTADEINETVTEHTLKLMPFYDAQRAIDPNRKEFYDMHEDFTKSTTEKASKMGTWWSNLLVGTFSASNVAKKIGIFVKVSEQTMPLAPSSSTSISSQPSLLPYGPARGVRGVGTSPYTPATSPSRPITGGNQVPFKPSKPQEDTFFTTQNIALIGVGAVALYVYATRKK